LQKLASIQGAGQLIGSNTLAGRYLTSRNSRLAPTGREESEISIGLDAENSTQTVAVHRTWPADLTPFVAGKGVSIEVAVLASGLPDVLVDRSG
jgi:hypothetical protein